MKSIFGSAISTLLATLVITGCNDGSPVEDQSANAEQLLCDNRDGVNAVMTGLAVAAAREMGRWIPTRDFRWNSSTDRLEISPYGYPRCPDRQCYNVRALLALQDAPNNTVKFDGGIVLNPWSLRAALKQNWIEQVNCVNSGRCVAESHDLKYQYWENGSCDVKYFFNAYKQGTTTRIYDTAALMAMNDNLTFLGWPENKMLNFYIRNAQVSVDPTAGLNEGGTTTSGSCTLGCSKFSMANIAGQCCACNGVIKRYVRSGFSYYMYLCQ